MKQTNKLMGAVLFFMFVVCIGRINALVGSIVNDSDHMMMLLDCIMCFIWIAGMCYVFIHAPWITIVKKEERQINAGTGPEIQ
jgi:hypothetical protein